MTAIKESLSRYSGGGMLTGTTPELIHGERRRVAVLFLDLTGFTGLGQMLDHEVLHDLVFSIMECFSGVVKSFGGYVDKFEGDRLMALFGATAAAENDSARAVGCALRLMDILDELRPSLPPGMSVGARAGIDAGPVTVAPDPSGHLTATGSAVNMASRIEEMSEPGKVTVSRTVRDECGELFDFAGLGPVAVRSFSDPVELFVPLGPGKARYERWERSSRVTGVPLVGREKETATLLGLLSDVRDTPEATCLVAIQGEAGSGKSRLLHHFLGKVEGATVLHGHAEHYSRTPFRIWIDLLRNHLDIREEGREEIRSRVMQLADECSDRKLGRKVLEEAGRLAELLSLAGKRTREETHSTVVAIRLALDAIGAGNDLVLALEDIHWIDSPSARVLELFVSSGGGPCGSMVVVTQRHSVDLPSMPGKDPSVIEIEPLTDRQIGSICSYLLSGNDLPAAVDDSLIEFISLESKGNPFYAEELVLNLLETGGIVHRDESWHLSIHRDDMEVPSTVQTLTQSRVDMLPGPDRKLLQLASVIGVTFPAGILEGLADRIAPGIDFAQVLENLVGRGYLLFESNKTLSFRHHLVQLSAYRTMLRHNRRIVHGMIAEEFEDSAPGETAVIASVIFNHWKHSGNRKKTLQWAAKALETACANEQSSEQRAIAETILQMTSSESQEEEWDARIAAMTALQSVMARAGDVSGALRIVDDIISEATARNEGREEVSALRLKCTLLNEMGRHDRMEDLFSKALKKAEDMGSRDLTAMMYCTMANHYSDTTRNDLALEYYEKALPVFEELGLEHFLVSVKTNLANLLSRTGRNERAAREFSEAVDLCRKLGIRSALGYALNGYAIEKAKAGELKRAGEIFEEALEYQIDIDNKALQASILNNLGVLTRMLGDNDRSLKYRLEGLRMSRESGNRRGEAIALINTASIYRLMEKFPEALEHALAAEELSLQIKDLVSACHALSIQGMVRLLMDRPDEALELYEKARNLLDGTGIAAEQIDDLKAFMDMLDQRGLTAEER